MKCLDDKRNLPPITFRIFPFVSPLQSGDTIDNIFGQFFKVKGRQRRKLLRIASPYINFADPIDILFLLSIRFVRFDGTSRLALFICERSKVVEVVILSGAFRPGIRSWGNSFDEAPKEAGSMENDFNHSVYYENSSRY
jgi:hypothetical protein